MSAPATAPIPGAGGSQPIKPEMKVEAGGVGAGDPNKKGPGPHQGGGGMGGQNNRGKRRRGGGGPMGGRGGGGGFQGHNQGGGRGGFHQGGAVERRPYNLNQNMNDSFDGGPQNKKPKVQGIDGRVLDRLRAIQGPSVDLPPKKFEIKKFLANTRLYIGNLPNEISEIEIKDMFTHYGEVDEVFINRDKNFAFLKLDYRTNAERARAELDQRQVRNRPIKVRFAPATVRVKVKNLNPMVSNELLEMAFSIFGDIERALVFVDDKGKSLGEGFIDFTRKNNAMQAHKICSDKCFFLTSDLRPVITEMGDMCEVDEGLLEMNLPKREFSKGREIEYYQARGIGPRFAEDGSFEHDFGEKWKKLIQEHKEKEIALKGELDKEFEKLQAQMEIEKYEYETEMLRQQLKQRELDHERQKLEWETRMQRIPRNNGPGGGPGPFGQGPHPGPGFLNGGQGGPPPMPPPDMEMCGDQNMADIRQAMPLAPPPMPPQGLMAHLQGPGAEPSGPTWEIGPFGFGGQMGGGNFGQPGFGSGRGGMGPGPRGGGPRGPFRGNRGGRR